ncbi:hypothetical protein CWS72_04405 [Telmatospirillum siberiense]|uniref:Uncharacterized protein n=1 Tax=Telmatospirillum siberiense TaxID=382514 RepID=A0A2N3PZI9_9PROT|nr:hypothetical protein CWS72_04405 [Telmatospirillum siberiense]
MIISTAALAAISVAIRTAFRIPASVASLAPAAVRRVAFAETFAVISVAALVTIWADVRADVSAAM